MIMWPFKKKPKEPRVTYTVTDVKTAEGGWVIRYSGSDGKNYESRIFRAYMNGEIGPEPQIGDSLLRLFYPGSMVKPPSFYLLIRGHEFKHYSVGRVQGIVD